MPSDKFVEGLTRVLQREVQRISELDDPIEREFEARELQVLLTPYGTMLRRVRSQSVQELCADPDTSYRDLHLVMGMSHQTIYNLAKRDD